MTTKERYCLYRSQELKQMRGMTLIQAWIHAEKEWKQGNVIPRNIEHRDDDYDDEMETFE